MPKSQKVTMGWPYVVEYVEPAGPQAALFELCEAGFDSLALAKHFSEFIGGVFTVFDGVKLSGAEQQAA